MTRARRGRSPGSVQSAGGSLPGRSVPGRYLPGLPGRRPLFRGAPLPRRFLGSRSPIDRRSAGLRRLPGPARSRGGSNRARWDRLPGRSARVDSGRSRTAHGEPTGRLERSPRRVPLERLLRRVPRPGRAAALRRQMEAAVPEVIDVLRAIVAAGINPRRALQAATEGAPASLKAVLDQAIRSAELGSGAGQALAAAAGAERLTELALAGEALDLAETTGAPPGPVLAGVAIAAADRVRSRQARMAATAQARLSARVVAAMAPAFLGVLALTSPTDAAFLIREPLGWATLAAAIVFELLGICWAARIVRGPVP
jgi:hypothetical protein